MNKILYWSPFTSKVATVKSVINSAESINRFDKNNLFKAYIINAVNEWDEFRELLNKKNIGIIDLNKKSIFNNFKKDGFLRSRIAYWYIFIKSFIPLNRILINEKPKFLIIHLITSLPLILFCIKKFETKLILRISGLPKMNILRKTVWKIASKNIHRITCPTQATYDDLSKYSFLRDKLEILSDPIINIKEINKSSSLQVNLPSEIHKIITTKRFLLSIGRFTKQKNFLFYLNCIPEILKLDNELYFLFIGKGEQEKKIKELSKQLNISDRILFINETDNVHYFMKKSQALVLTSLWEDPGFVIVESGYNNCQVISSNCPNGPSEIINNDGGYLFESNSQLSLISTMKKFLEDDKKNKNSKKIILKKRIKKFTSFHHRIKLFNDVLND
jgi:glycosyltransferase involved in cell wall biosynthesis